MLKGTAVKTSAESPDLEGRLLQESTSSGDPTVQQSVRSSAGGTHTELSKVDPYSDVLVSGGFILSLKKKKRKFRLGYKKNLPRELPHHLVPDDHVGCVQEQSSYCLCLGKKLCRQDLRGVSTIFFCCQW